MGPFFSWLASKLAPKLVHDDPYRDPYGDIPVIDFPGLGIIPASSSHPHLSKIAIDHGEQD